MAARRGACATFQLKCVSSSSKRLGKAVNERMFLGRGFVYAGTRKTHISGEGESHRIVQENRRKKEGQRAIQWKSGSY